MVQIFTVRERLAALPATVRRRAETASARASVVADARAVVPEIPRTADAGHLERAARRLLRRAAQDEFAREGVARLHLPEAASRIELRQADVPGDAAFHAFVEDVLSAVDIAPSPLERDDAVELRDARGSWDAYGLSPEVAADLASYLLGRAHALHEDAAPLEDYLGEQAALIREDMRAALVRQVRVPLELKVARDRHARLGSGEAEEPPVGPPGTEEAADGDRADMGRRARAAFEFAQSEAGRAAFGALRSGAERAYERYGTRTPPRTPPRT